MSDINFRPLNYGMYKVTTVPITYQKCPKCGREVPSYQKCLCGDYQRGYQKGMEDGIDEFADWLVEQGILGNRVISDGEITDYGKVYAKQFKQQLKNR